MLTTNDVDMQVVHTLASFGTIVDNCAVPIVHAFHSSDFSYCDHKVTQESCMAILSLANACESVTVLGDDQEVLGCHWGNVSECQAFVVFVDNVSWDLFADNFVKNSDFLGLRALSKCLFSSFHCSKLK